ncbi:MAG TPA: hypothetical protein VH643_08920 [Gemmataceae bacterium]|jgi:hypothetical protein
MRNRRWLWVAVALLTVALLVFAYQWLGEGGSLHGRSERGSLRGRFDRVAAGMSQAEVLEVMGPPQDQRSSKRWPPQVSEYAEVWQVHGGEFVRHEYRGQEVHTQVGLPGRPYAVWKDDEGVIVIGYDAEGRVCGKIRLTE